MYHVHLEKFEGPLDLLLYFIRRDEIDIYDIPIARITADYLQALEDMKRFNIRVAGEFVEMAATLIRIKAQMLLPRPSLTEETPEDPRSQLVQQLLEYQQFKHVARELERLAAEQGRFFPRGKEQDPPGGEEDPEVYFRQVDIYDIARYFRKAIQNRPMIRTYDLQREPVDLEDQKAFLLAQFDQTGRCSFTALLSRLETRTEVVVTFMALLELMRQSLVMCVQESLFGEIMLYQTSRHQA
ncbi:MAG: chromosome segregation protein ScpA [Candidatus Neomarinimicrobiota bacterium]|nr:MAG: chromosome segregation protein ScpA [Candidatus Neomarinimicrobiota bacterium]